MLSAKDALRIGALSAAVVGSAACAEAAPEVSEVPEAATSEMMPAAAVRTAAREAGPIVVYKAPT